MQNIRDLQPENLKHNGWEISENALSSLWLKNIHSFVLERMNALKQRFEEWTGEEVQSYQDYQNQQKKFKEYEESQIPKDCRNYLLGMLDVPTRLDKRFTDLFSEPQFIENILDLVQSKEIYFYYPPMVRFSIPGSTTSMVPVHQDSIFATQFKNFHTLWFALVDITEETPGMNLYDKSHLDGPLPHRNESAWGHVADVDLSKYKKFPLRMKAGDLLIFDPHFLHESASNTGANIRFSMDLRMVTSKDDINTSYWDAQKKVVVRLD